MDQVFCEIIIKFVSTITIMTSRQILMKKIQKQNMIKNGLSNIDLKIIRKIGHFIKIQNL